MPWRPEMEPLLVIFPPVLVCMSTPSLLVASRLGDEPEVTGIASIVPLLSSTPLTPRRTASAAVARRMPVE